MDALPIDDALGGLREAMAQLDGPRWWSPRRPGSGEEHARAPALLPFALGQVHLPAAAAAGGRDRARRARIAREQQWLRRLGREVGYRVRFEHAGDASTRLWVMTEGTLTRQLQSDPYLEGVGSGGARRDPRAQHPHRPRARLPARARRQRAPRAAGGGDVGDHRRRSELCRFLLDGAGGRPARRARIRWRSRLLPQTTSPRPRRARRRGRARGARRPRLRRRARLPARGGGDPRLRARARGPAPGGGAAPWPAASSRAGARAEKRRAPARGAQYQCRRDLGHHPGGAHGGRRRLRARRGHGSRERGGGAHPRADQPRQRRPARRPRRPHRAGPLRAAVERARGRPARARDPAEGPPHRPHRGLPGHPAPGLHADGLPLVRAA